MQDVKVVGFHVNAWCKATGISRQKYYTLPRAMRPFDAKIGSRRIIREAPEDWLRRMSELEKKESEKKPKSDSNYNHLSYP
jgi:hypothetical protein